MSLELKPAYDAPKEIKELFTEYTNMLIDCDPVFKQYLSIQNYDDELLHLEKKYGPPEGRLYIAWIDGKAAGCIGLRKIDEKSCEMKRLYVRPEFRGHKLGEILIQRILDDAKEIGYERMLLDTLPVLQSALHLYRRFGFYEIECYNDSPMTDGIYMRYDL